MFPSLHEDILRALSGEIIDPEPWFNESGSEEEAIGHRDTKVMGTFTCNNEACPKRSWGSKIVAITIWRFPDGGYNAVLYLQRCKACKQLGTLRLDERSYIERITYRLKKWAGIQMERPPFKLKINGPEHERDLCEGCKRGHCMVNSQIGHRG